MADSNEDYLSVNGDFERVPDTPMERVENGGQKTPKGFTASEFGNQSKEPANMFVLN